MFHKAQFTACLCAQILSSIIVYSLELKSGNKIKAVATYAPASQLWCSEETVGGGYGNFTFPPTVATNKGFDVRVECPFGFRNDGLERIYEEGISIESKASSSGATRKCLLVSEEDGNFHGKWEPPIEAMQITHENYCRTLSAVEAEEEIKKEFNSITLEVFIRISIKLNKIETIMLNNMDDYPCVLAYVNGIADLLTSPVLNGPEGIDSNGRQILMRALDNYRDNILLYIPAGCKLQVGTAGIIVETVKFYGAQFYHRSFYPFSIYQLKPYYTAFETVDETNVNVKIPTEALQLSMDQMREPKLKITAFSDDVFKNVNENYGSTTFPNALCAPSLDFNSDNSSPSPSCNSVTNSADEDGNHKDGYESWGLLTIELDGTIENLTDSVEFVISNTKTGYKFTCVYWDVDAERWSTAGVTTTEMDNEVKCSSTHLTAFSALIEPLPLPFPGAEYAPVNNSVHGFILSILSSIGSVCSIIGLSFTVLTYALFRSLRRERSNRILLNLSSSLLLMHIMAISGSKSLWDGYCFLPAASLHYLVLTSFAWMMVEALHMFELLISVFVRPENYFLTKRFVLAWGIPLLIVIISTVIDPEMYKAGRADLCLMNAHENIVIYYVAYIAPICIMLLVNIVVFFRVFRVLYQQTRRTRGSTSTKGSTTKIQFVKISRSQIKGAVTVLVLLGIGWILGLLAIGPFEILFRYLYCVCNAGQGALIFIFRVALNPHACKQWKKVILGLSPDSSLDVSVTTSSSVGGRGNKRKSTIVSPTFISASNSVENSLTPSDPLAASLATTLASMLRSEDERAMRT